MLHKGRSKWVNTANRIVNTLFYSVLTLTLMPNHSFEDQPTSGFNKLVCIRIQTIYYDSIASC